LTATKSKLWYGETKDALTKLTKPLINATMVTSV